MQRARSVARSARAAELAKRLKRARKSVNARKALLGEASKTPKPASSEFRARARRAVNARKAFVSEAAGTGCRARRRAMSGESWACRAYGSAAGF